MKCIVKFLCLAALVALSACGGSDHGGPPATTPPVVTPPATMVDAFYAAVLALLGDSSDSKEPVAIDPVAVTTPDNTEPEAVK
jgi:hypothetical protein